jgi:hypothetical protein
MRGRTDCQPGPAPQPPPLLLSILEFDLNSQSSARYNHHERCVGSIALRLQS